MTAKIAVRPPPNSSRIGKGKAMKMPNAMYGTRMASQLCQNPCAKVLTEDSDFLHNRSDESLYWSPTLNIKITIHRNDFFRERDLEDLDVLDELLDRWFATKRLPGIGPGPGKSGRYFNRRIGWSEEGFTWEADRKHLPLMREELGLLDDKISKVPGPRDPAKESNSLDEVYYIRRSTYMPVTNQLLFYGRIAWRLATR
jgi:hypothetical protein